MSPSGPLAQDRVAPVAKDTTVTPVPVGYAASLASGETANDVPAGGGGPATAGCHCGFPLHPSLSSENRVLAYSPNRPATPAAAIPRIWVRSGDATAATVLPVNPLTT